MKLNAYRHYLTNVPRSGQFSESSESEIDIFMNYQMNVL